MDTNNLRQIYRKDSPYIFNVDYNDILRGMSYLKLYCSAAYPKATIYESYTSGDDSSAHIGSNTTWFCQTFTVGTTGADEDFYVNGVELYLYADFDGDKIIVSIQEVDGAGKPDGTDIAYGETETDAVTDGVAGTDDVWVKINFLKDAKLASATKYAIVIRRYSADTIDLRYDGSAPSYTGGSYGSSADSGATWTMDTDKDFLFKVLGDTKPILSFFEEDLQNASSYTHENIGDDGSYGEQFRADISIIIGKSINIKGDAIINIPADITLGINNEGVSFYYTAELFKRTGTTDTSIGTAVSKCITTGTDGARNLLLRLNIDEKRHFNEDNELVLRIIFYSMIDDGGTGSDVTIEFKDIWMNLPIDLT